MHAFIFKWLTVGFAAILASSTVTMVAAFFGFLENLRDLLLLQMLLIPVAIATLVLALVMLARRSGRGNVLHAFWAELPGWLVLIVTLALSLVLIAELSFILVQWHIGDFQPWVDHMPAASAFFSSIALAACYVVLHLDERGAGALDAGRSQQPVDRQP